LRHYEETNKLYADTIKYLENELIDEKQSFKLVFVTQENKDQLDEMMNKIHENVEFADKEGENDDITAHKIAQIIVETFSKTIVKTITVPAKKSTITKSI
jgi:hypothetical protein